MARETHTPTEMVLAYGCTVCQRYHYKGEPLYEEHLGWQSKHGINRRAWRYSDTAAVNERAALRDALRSLLGIVTEPPVQVAGASYGVGMAILGARAVLALGEEKP